MLFYIYSSVAGTLRNLIVRFFLSVHPQPAVIHSVINGRLCMMCSIYYLLVRIIKNIIGYYIFLELYNLVCFTLSDLC